MQGYKRFLKILLACDMVFVVGIALFSYSQQREEIALEVSNNLGESNSVAVSEKKNEEGSEDNKVIPVGKTVVIYVNTEGILVIDTGEVTDMEGNHWTPAKNKLLSGDYITSLNGENISSKKELITKITECNGETLVFGIERNGQHTETAIEPVETEVNQYKVGIWVRDDLQGLGTITYVDDDSFGALGHSINDADTGELLQVSGGQIYEADIYGVEKGESGTPGVIEGVITYQTENVVGNVANNNIYGIFGNITDEFLDVLQNEEALEIAKCEEVVPGKAYIQSYVSGEKALYEIEILNIHNNNNGDLEMEIKVTDDNLLALTGGIIQGMSGSPVIQNGKLAGAVTHVFVDDPTRGYAIFVEIMKEKTDSVK
jgi:stage IV sporulation protein B